MWIGISVAPSASMRVAVAQILDAVGKAVVLPDHLGDRGAREALAQMGHPSQVVAMAMGQHDALGPRPPALAEVGVEQRDVARHARPRVDQDRMGAADEVGIRAGPGHHPGVEAEDAADQIGRLGGPWEN